jgi:MFS family permease
MTETSPAAPPAEKQTPLPLRLGSFRNLLLTRMFMMMALQAQAVIVGWQVYSMTKSVFILGLIGLTEAVPAIACALVAGHVVDHGNPKKIYLLTVGTLAVNAAVLLMTAGGYIDLPHHVLLPLIFVGIFFSGLARGFLGPSSFTLLSRIVDKPDMPQAAAWLSSGFQLAAVTGPAIAGLVYAAGGPHSAWWMPVGLMTTAFFMVTTLRPRPPAPRTTEREPAWQSIRAGWRYILNNQVLLSMMALDMFAVMFGGALAMLPAYADQVLGVGAEGLGILRAAPAAGAILTALVLALRPMRYIVARRLLVVVTGYGIAMIAFGLSREFWLSAALLALGGAFDSVSMIMRGTLMQLLTPEDMKGRLSSINSMFIISSNEIGSFVQGTTARILGLVPGIVFGGCMTLLVVALTATMAPVFRRTIVDSKTPPVIPSPPPGTAPKPQEVAA